MTIRRSFERRIRTIDSIRYFMICYAISLFFLPLMRIISLMFISKTYQTVSNLILVYSNRLLHVDRLIETIFIVWHNQDLLVTLRRILNIREAAPPRGNRSSSRTRWNSWLWWEVFNDKNNEVFVCFDIKMYLVFVINVYKFEAILSHENVQGLFTDSIKKFVDFKKISKLSTVI